MARTDLDSERLIPFVTCNMIYRDDLEQTRPAPSQTRLAPSRTQRGMAHR